MKPELIALSLSGIVVLAIGSRWLAWRLRFPAILLLLLIGLLAGPVCELAFGWRLLDPDAAERKHGGPFSLGLIVRPGRAVDRTPLT